MRRNGMRRKGVHAGPFFDDGDNVRTQRYLRSKPTRDVDIFAILEAAIFRPHRGLQRLEFGQKLLSRLRVQINRGNDVNHGLLQIGSENENTYRIGSRTLAAIATATRIQEVNSASMTFAAEETPR